MEFLLEGVSLLLIGKALWQLVSGQIVLRYGWATVTRQERPMQYWLLMLIDAGLAIFVGSLAWGVIFPRH